MVWSKQEFEREVRRQLVELASLRKRVPPAKELLERIDRLEASQQYLLRKLSEFFKEAEAATSAPPANAPALSAAAEPPAEPFETNSGLPQQAPSDVEVSAGNLVLALEHLQGTSPDVNEQCAACGKVLLSSILAGAKVVYEDPSWYHATCVKGGGGFGKQGTLN